MGKKGKNKDGGELMLPAHIFKKKGFKSDYEVIDTERINKIFPKEKKIETAVIADEEKPKPQRRSAKPKTEEVTDGTESSEE